MFAGVAVDDMKIPVPDVATPGRQALGLRGGAENLQLFGGGPEKAGGERWRSFR